MEHADEGERVLNSWIVCSVGIVVVFSPLKSLLKIVLCCNELAQSLLLLKCIFYVRYSSFSCSTDAAVRRHAVRKPQTWTQKPFLSTDAVNKLSPVNRRQPWPQSVCFSSLSHLTQLTRQKQSCPVCLSRGHGWNADKAGRWQRAASLHVDRQ